MSSHEHSTGENAPQEQSRVPLLQRRLSRRGFIEGAAVGAAGMTGLLMVGCGSEGRDEELQSAPTPSETLIDPLLDESQVPGEKVAEGIWYAKGLIPDQMKQRIGEQRNGLPSIEGEHDGTVFIKASDGKIYPVAAFNGLWRRTQDGRSVESISVSELAGEIIDIGGSSAEYQFSDHTKRVKEVNPVIGDDVAESKTPSFTEIFTHLTKPQQDKKGQQLTVMMHYGSDPESSTSTMPFGRKEFELGDFSGEFNVPLAIADNTEIEVTGKPVSSPIWTTISEGGVDKKVIMQAFERGIYYYDEGTGEVKIQTSGDLAVKIIVPGIAADMTPEERSPQEEEVKEKGLKDYGKALGIDIGVLPDPAEPYSKLRELHSKEFNLGVPTFNMSHHAPARGEYDFKWTDGRMRYTMEFGEKARLQHVLFPFEYAEWFKQLQGDELREAMKEYVRDVSGHFRDADSIVVVNEPWIAPYRINDHLYDQFGYDYIVEAFRTAREATNARLIFNDSGNHSSNGASRNGLTTELSRQIVQKLQSEGLIDALGVQMHLYGDEPPSREDIASTLKSYGIPVEITEMDIDMSQVQGSREEVEAKQAKIMSNAINGVLDSGVCQSITLWGVGDRLSWIEKNLGRTNADPTPFDDDFNPKPSYYAFRDALSARI